MPALASDLADILATICRPGDYFVSGRVDFLVDLMTALSAIAPPLAGRAANHLLANPETYGFDAALIPAMLKLIPGPPLPAVVPLRAACLAHLRAASPEPLEAPRDWRRESRLPCSCENCRELARFLADPERQSWVFKAAQGRRTLDLRRPERCRLHLRTQRQPPHPDLHQKPSQL